MKAGKHDYSSERALEPKRKPTQAVLRAEGVQAKGFQAHRAARRNVIIEDYVELIADLLHEGHEARQVDIAERLGVSQPTVAKVLNRLSEEGLITRKLYRGIFLTEKGHALAKASRQRHRTVEAFLRALGVSAESSAIDAESIEHYVSAETLSAFKKALNGGLADFMTRCMSQKDRA